MIPPSVATWPNWPGSDFWTVILAGATLAEDVGLEADYRIRGDEGYVRAIVTSSNGTKAWIQPVWLK